MNLIERAADILGSETALPQKKEGVPVNPPVAGTLERAVDHQSELVQREAATARRVDREPTERNAVSKIVNINHNKLRMQNFITPEDPRTPVSENFRRIKRHILANLANPHAGQARNLVMITSALPGEGKTFCAINLAISIAMEMDRTVLLVDADVARPSIASVLGLKGEPGKGLMDVLLDRRVELSSVLYRTDIEKLSILTAGSSHKRATEALASERMRELLEEMANRYHDRVIVFDSPPLLAASEASALASLMGQILVVVEAGRTAESVVKEALSRIESTNVLGVLLNKGSSPEAGYYGGYGYGYGYGPSA